jgi:hypothetical protein
MKMRGSQARIIFLRLAIEGVGPGLNENDRKRVVVKA